MTVPRQINSNVIFSDFLINPKKAEEWLNYSSKDDEFKNRKLNDQKVSAYAKEMKEGRWKSKTGECIKFAPDGVLIDGQHRLRAIIKSNISIVLTVAKNVPKENATVIDTGMSRSISDAMTIKKIPCANEHAAGIKQYYQFTRGSLKDNQSQLSNDLAIQMYEDETDFWRNIHSRSAIFYREIGHKISPSFIYAAIAYLEKHSRHKNRIDEFFEELCIDGKVKNGTVKNLRKKIDEFRDDSKYKIKKNYVVAYFAKTWNAFIDDKTKALQYDPSVEGIVDMKTCK